MTLEISLNKFHKDLHLLSPLSRELSHALASPPDQVIPEVLEKNHQFGAYMKISGTQYARGAE